MAYPQTQAALNVAVNQVAGRVCPRGWNVGCEGDYDGRPRVPFDVRSPISDDQETVYAFTAWRLAVKADSPAFAGRIMQAQVETIYGKTEQSAWFKQRIAQALETGI